MVVSLVEATTAWLMVLNEIKDDWRNVVWEDRETNGLEQEVAW